MVTTVSCNGNFLLNVGPTKSGIISPIFEERLRQMGAWLNTNGEGIYSSRPWTYQNDTLTPGVWYTTNNQKVYAFIFNWAPTVDLAAPQPLGESSQVDLLGGASQLHWVNLKPSGITVSIPWTPNVQWVWVLRLTGFTSK